ncbi:MAG: carboxypeptidase-like regulatory domain-containing protein [Muribaculaceae bacterium]|nr:carboxypeptidase-like regulatory domain-containing protein [Muribaculaceae bacterium]
MNRLLIVIILGILSTASVLARETVKGTVVDAKGEPIPGVRVEVPGNSEFVFTDLDGMFQIILREPTKNLKFSYPGYSPATYKVKPEMTVVMGKGWAGHEKGSRSMIDLEGGIGLNGKATFISGNMQAKDVQTFLMTGMMITSGIQINRHLFVGIGTGAHLELDKADEIDDYWNGYDSWLHFPFTGVNVPLYLNARWDFGLTKKTAPYIDLRIGYNRFFRAGEDYGEISWISNYNNQGDSYLIVSQEGYGSFFIAPSIGYRVSIYKKFGMNFGLRYMAGLKKKYSATTRSYSNDNHENIYSYNTFTQRGSDMLFFNIGFDF